ncbi:hypothetical protein C8J57DRAFT_1735348 [Mycena rebaudengoi]|nr:hypothetical protein C8J57DRAFT_1735348 [Mycena rebaudengoi]
MSHFSLVAIVPGRCSATCDHIDASPIPRATPGGAHDLDPALASAVTYSSLFVDLAMGKAADVLVEGRSEGREIPPKCPRYSLHPIPSTTVAIATDLPGDDSGRREISVGHPVHALLLSMPLLLPSKTALDDRAVFEDEVSDGPSASAPDMNGIG